MSIFVGRPYGAMRAAGIVAVVGSCLAAVVAGTASVSAQESYQRISGEGSSWAATAIDAMRVNVKQFGITVDYNASGSTSGRKNFLNGTVDFAASDIPFQFAPEDGSAPEKPAPGSYAYIPVTAGGTSFMYNLKINGKQVTNLRLSGENVAKLFTGAIAMWNDPALAADNPGITLPARKVVPVVRSDGSGSTAQFTKWMIDRHPAIWQDYCQKSGRAPACGFTSFYPTIAGMIAQSGDVQVAGYVASGFAEGAIGYVNYSYALGVEFPVAKVLNAAGFYTEPTPDNVAVSLLKAQINTDESNPEVYLTQKLEGVYTDTDPRSYQLSSYSYFILPTKIGGQFNEAKGRTLGAFAYYAMCQAQQQSASLGYSPMPINLVQASFDQIQKIPGVVVQDVDIKSCKNPTFSADGHNVLADQAPQPKACDKQGASQCPDGTGGLKDVPTATANSGGGATAGGAATGGAATAGGATTGGATTGGATTGGATAGGATTGGSTTGGATRSGGATTASGATATTVAGGSSPSGGDPLNGPVILLTQDDTTVQNDASADDNSSGNEVALGQVTPVTLRQGSPGILLVLIVVLLALGLVVGPAFAWRQFSQRKPA